MKKHRLLVAVFASLAIYGWSGDSEIIVESYSDGLNSQAFSKVDGRWLESTAKSTAPGVKGTKTVFNDANQEPGVAKFTPDVPVAGKYEVFITYPVQGNATDVKYTVVSSDGSKDINVTQFGRDLKSPAKANEWFSLGTFNFAAGTTGFVQVTDPMTGEYPYKAETNARIYADAIKLVPQGFSLPADYANKPGEASEAPAVIAESAPAAAVAAAPALPNLPGTEVAAAPPATGLPSLPASTPANAMPGLPAVTAVPADSALPSLPGASPTPGLPSLPGAANPAGLPALPTVTPGLPALPESSPAAGLPGLPGTTAASGLPALPGAATPIPSPDFATLVTPTPANRRPSASDTPVPSLPPLPGPGMPALPTGVGTPAVVPALPPVASVPAMPAIPGMPSATPAAAVKPSTDVSITQYNPSGLQWVYDFGSGLNQARAQNKKVLVFFTAGGNQTATRYETEYFNHPNVRQALDNYVLVKIDFPKNTRLGYSLGVFGAGVIAVTDNSGNITARIQQLPSTPMDLLQAMASVKPATSASADGTSETAAASDAAVPAIPMPGADAGASSAPAEMPALPDPAAATPAGAAPAAMPALPAIPGAEAAPAAPAVPAAPAPGGNAADAMPALPNIQ